MAYVAMALVLILLGSAFTNLAIRGTVIALLHRVGKYEQFGSPRDLYLSDKLPWETLHLRNISQRERLLVRAFFSTWVTMWIAFPLCFLVFALS